MSENKAGPLWPEDFDQVALRDSGFTYEETREAHRRWNDSVPLYVRKESEAWASAFIDRLYEALDALGEALGIEPEERKRLSDGTQR